MLGTRRQTTEMSGTTEMKRKKGLGGKRIKQTTKHNN